MLLLDPFPPELCEFPLCEFMFGLEEDWFWLLLDDDEFEVLCAAAASVNTRNANNRRRVTRFMTFLCNGRRSRSELDGGRLAG
jgi:hypothetical protein